MRKVTVSEKTHDAPAQKKRRITRSRLGASVEHAIVLDSSSSDDNEDDDDDDIIDLKKTDKSSNAKRSRSSSLIQSNIALENADFRRNLSRAMAASLKDLNNQKKRQIPSENTMRTSQQVHMKKQHENEKSVHGEHFSEEKPHNIQQSKKVDLKKEQSPTPETTTKLQEYPKNNSQSKSGQHHLFHGKQSSTSDSENNKKETTKKERSFVESLQDTSPRQNCATVAGISRNLIKKDNLTAKLNHKRTDNLPSNSFKSKNARDIYSVCCIPCMKMKRSQYCNRQKPCDICSGKKRRCHYPDNAKIVVPAKSVKNSKGNVRPRKYNLNSITGKDGNNNEGNEEKSHLTPVTTPFTAYKNDYFDFHDGKAKSESRLSANICAAISTPGIDDSNLLSSEKLKEIGTFLKVKPKSITVPAKVSKSTDSQSGSNNGTGFREQTATHRKVLPTRKNATTTKIIGKKDTVAETTSESDVSDDTGESDVSDVSDVSDNSWDEEDYKEDAQLYKEDEYIRKSKAANKLLFAQRQLAALEFENRDVNIYDFPPSRRRRATKQNYKLDTESEAEEDNGYEAAASRNEQLILSEDEEERRMLRGEIDATYLNSRKEPTQYQYDDGLSSSSEPDI